MPAGFINSQRPNHQDEHHAVARRLALPLSLIGILAYRQSTALSSQTGLADTMMRSLQRMQPDLTEQASEIMFDTEQDNDDGALPNCLTFMQQHDSSAYQNGDFITQVPHTWTLRPDGSRQLDLTEVCTLHRYTPTQAQQCLRDQHLLFVGDSLTRFQVTSLVHLLHKGQYPPRFEIQQHPNNCTHLDDTGRPTCSPPNVPNVCDENNYKNAPFDNPWKSFHHQIGGAMDGGIFDGHLECNCARGGVVCPPDMPGCDVENFLYTSNNNITNTTVSFYFEAGWGDTPRPIKGFQFTDCSQEGRCRQDETLMATRVQRASRADYDWSHPLEDAMRWPNGTFYTAHDHRVDVAIYNRGLWGLLTEPRARLLLPLFENLVQDRCFFKSTTGSPRRSPPAIQHEQGPIRRATQESGCSFLDFGHLTSDFAGMSQNTTLCPERKEVYVDEVHFRPWVYEELNNALLNVLCGGKKY